MVKILMTISPLCTLLPARTPKQLMMVNSASARPATTLSESGTCVSSLKWRAKMIATAAMPPVCVTSSKAQP